MLLSDLTSDRRVIFVGGKGGVGKTTTASGVALQRARQGARVLVVSTDPAHNLGHLWDREVGDAATLLWESPDVDGASLTGLEIDPEATMRTHLDDVGASLRSMMPGHLHGEVDRHLDLASRTPGTHESALLERIAVLLDRELWAYDLIVFDTAPSGHTARLMALPEIMSVWTESLLDRRAQAERFGAAVRALDGGHDAHQARDQRIRQILHARRSRFESMRTILRDPNMCGFIMVSTADRLAVAESVELHRQLTELGVDVTALLVNRMSPHEAGGLLAERASHEGVQVERIAEALPRTPLLTAPLFAGDGVGEAALTAWATSIRPSS